MSNRTILTPIAAQAYKNNNVNLFGAIEMTEDTGEIIWEFNALNSQVNTPRLYETSKGVEHRGFRPTSVQRLENGLTLISGWRSALWVDENGRIIRKESHKYMNDVHETQQTDYDTYLVASTGMDMILEFNYEWELVHQWNMWEHVDDELRPPDYYPDKILDKDCRNIAGNPDNRFHLNYATALDSDRILCSALNYGVFMVDRWGGDIIWEYTDIDECHNPAKAGDDFIVCESGKDRIVKIDEDGNQSIVFDENLHFPKDCDNIEGDTWLICDCRNDRLLIRNSEEDDKVKEFGLPDDSRPYEADILKGSDTHV